MYIAADQSFGELWHEVGREFTLGPKRCTYGVQLDPDEFRCIKEKGKGLM